MSINHLPKRSEVWLVNFGPTIGAEIKKKRPAVVVNSNAVGILPIKLIALITDWQDRFKNNIWHIKVTPDNQNGPSKMSAIDTIQIRGVDTQLNYTICATWQILKFYSIYKYFKFDTYIR